MGAVKIMLPGINVPIEVVSDEEAEEADFIVCGSPGPTPWLDNVETTCGDCGSAVIHRPHAPKRPRKVCVACALLRMEGGTA